MSNSTPSETDKVLFCGIDVGGTKIEAIVFDSELSTVRSRRDKTPVSSYGALIESLKEIILWAENGAENGRIEYGIGIPGLIDCENGVSNTSNIPATGKKFASDLAEIAGHGIAIENDCNCFALSEANGSNKIVRRMIGLTIGTGLGCGICENGSLVHSLNNAAGEIGHVSLPANIASELGLPILQCGCGRMGCYETIVSGKGFANLDEFVNGTKRSGLELTNAAESNDSGARKVLDIWESMLGELLHTLQLTVDPDCIVIGGGVSNLRWIADGARNGLLRTALKNLRIPDIRLTEFGDSSGSRGAALLAKQNWETQRDLKS